MKIEYSKYEGMELWERADAQEKECADIFCVKNIGELLGHHFRLRKPMPTPISIYGIIEDIKFHPTGVISEWAIVFESAVLRRDGLSIEYRQRSGWRLTFNEETYGYAFEMKV